MLSLLVALPLLVQETADVAPPDPYLELAHELEAGLAAGNGELIDDRFDPSFLIANATRGLSLPEEERVGFEEALRSSLRFGPGIVMQVFQNLGSYHFLRLLPEKDGYVRALFRLQSSTVFDYHELYLAPVEGGAIRVVDVHRHTQGMRISERIRRGFRSSAFFADPSYVNEVQDEERPFLQSIEDRSLLEQAAKGDPPLAMTVFEKLDPAVQKEEQVLLDRLTAARVLDQASYTKALEELARHHPDSTALPLAWMEYHLGHENWVEARKWVETNAARIDDPFLDVFRARISLREGDLGMARIQATRAKENDPRLARMVTLVLLEVSLAAEDHRGTLALLVELESVHEVDFGDLAHNPDFTAFVKSASYEEWTSR